ncbi:MAG TPA: hypothetical protein VGR78_14815 [Verrucomicrobiae bacterium]|jgi:hypothetical protein|nr:hypothetical protein [Verrucomicrobiae bacterium]
MNPNLFFSSLVALGLSIANVFCAPPDVSGKWKWNIDRNGEEIEITMDVKQQDAKLTGKVHTPQAGDMDLHDGKISEDGKLSFYINYERDQGPLRIDFRGKAQQDKIEGQVEYPASNGEKREREWNPKREANKHDVSGEWKSTFKRQDGSDMESSLTLKQSGDKVTGKNEFNGNETEIQDGKIQGDEISFKIVRDRDGRTVTSKYFGQIKGNNSIKGHIDSDWTGEVRKLEWEAKKN